MESRDAARAVCSGHEALVALADDAGRVDASHRNRASLGQSRAVGSAWVDVEAAAAVLE